jgi:uncharacterized RDD family membrane protein YckC
MAYAPSTTLDPTNVMGRRIGAFIIDVVVPSVIALAIGWSIFVGSATKITGVSSDYCTFANRPLHTACFQVGNDAYVGTSADARHAFTVAGLVYLIGALNLFVVQGISGAAVGKHIFGLRVIRADGSLVGFGWNALRTVLLVVDEFFCFLVGLITASVTHPHRRVGDFAAGSFVVAKQAVGTPMLGAMPVAYPPAWTPPPVGQPWGAPQPAGQQQWGAPPATAPQPAATPSAWGTPAAAVPIAAVPMAEPSVAEPPAETTVASESTDATSDAPGWAAPTPAVEAAPFAAAAAPQAAAPARESQWDAQRNAWVYWEAETSRWLQFDAASGQWGPLR